MTRNRRILLTAAVALVFGGSGALLSHWLNGKTVPSTPDAAAAGQMLLQAHFTGLKNEPQKLAQWSGKVLVINFWATWCEPCREEIPGFIALQQRYASKNVQFVGIAIDQKDLVIPYIKQIGINYPIVIGGIDAMVLAQYAGNSKGVLPFTAVLDTGGRVVAEVTGVYLPEKLQNTLDKLLLSVDKM